MRKQNKGRAFAGGDVSSKDVVVALQRSDGGRERAEFANNAPGHKLLISWLARHGSEVQIVIEATGIYSLDLAFALQRAKGVEVMVANPRAIADFARALMQRSKTDKLDAEAILEFSCRMPFVPWIPPSQARLDLRSIMRRVFVEAADATGKQPASRGRACRADYLVHPPGYRDAPAADGASCRKARCASVRCRGRRC